MISVVVPTLNAAPTLAASLGPLIPAAVNNLVREVVIADAGSTDHTLEIADDAGARLVSGDWTAGCAAAKGPWLLLLSPRIRLAAEWEAAARDHMEHHAAKAGWFRFALDDHSAAARLREAAAAAFGGPAPGRGLLLTKRLYEEAGGSARGEAELIRALRPRLRPLAARAFEVK